MKIEGMNKKTGIKYRNFVIGTGYREWNRIFTGGINRIYKKKNLIK